MRQKSDYVYREVRLNVRRKGIIPKFYDYGHGVVRKNGHVSLYAITHEIARKIAISGSIKGWMPIHYSSICWIDVDDLQAGDEVEQRCKDLDFDYQRYFSGMKGWHFAIRREVEPSPVVYAQDRVFVREHFSDLSCYTHFDLGIYRPLHLFRAVGCYHEKSRKQKVLVSEHRGKNIPDISDYEPDILVQRTAKYESYEYSDDPWNDLKHTLCFHNGVANGSRYQTLWRLGKDLFKLGLNYTQVMSLAEVYNGSFQDPHSHSEIERAIKDAKQAALGEDER